nr:hypothetical protein [uncultured Agathobaculum sp.]
MLHHFYLPGFLCVDISVQSSTPRKQWRPFSGQLSEQDIRRIPPVRTVPTHPLSHAGHAGLVHIRHMNRFVDIRPVFFIILHRHRMCKLTKNQIKAHDSVAVADGSALVLRYQHNAPQLTVIFVQSGQNRQIFLI